MICIIASAGGHLTEVMKAISFLKEYPIFYITFKMAHIQDSLKNEEYYLVEDPHISLKTYFINFYQVLKIYFRQRPKVIVTTGAGIAVPMCLIGKAFGSKVVFIESGARVIYPSRTAKILYRIADLSIVQWKPLLKYLPRAIYGGPLV
jgi:UDP-N-acetylglucosamine:LPS N-acetylglucosamine transferase